MGATGLMLSIRSADKTKRFSACELLMLVHGPPALVGRKRCALLGGVEMVDSHSGNLWAITCYFNPVGYRRRLENYRVFRQHLAVPLVTVELSFNGRFQLQPEDAEILEQLQGGDVLWQKERLLNVALRSLPESCEKIAWVDCDIIFANNEWVERASKALEEFPLLHLFHERHEVPRDSAPDQLGCWETYPTSQSVVYRRAVGQAAPEEVYISGNPLKRRSSSGLAWAGRRDVLLRRIYYGGRRSSNSVRSTRRV
jgi:hypothetical protein